MSDSAYLVNGFADGFVYRWKENMWHPTNRNPTKNKNVWEALINQVERHHNVLWIKIKAHSGNNYNDRVDKLAALAAKNQ